MKISLESKCGHKGTDAYMYLIYLTLECKLPSEWLHWFTSLRSTENNFCVNKSHSTIPALPNYCQPNRYRMILFSFIFGN